MIFFAQSHKFNKSFTMKNPFHELGVPLWTDMEWPICHSDTDQHSGGWEVAVDKEFYSDTPSERAAGGNQTLKCIELLNSQDWEKLISPSSVWTCALHSDHWATEQDCVYLGITVWELNERM